MAPSCERPLAEAPDAGSIKEHVVARLSWSFILGLEGAYVQNPPPFQLLIGPWRQAIGMLTPVGPGIGAATRTPVLPGERIG